MNSEIFFKKGTRTYQVNALYFRRGHWNDIQEIRLQQRYSEKGRDFKTEIIYKENK